MEARIKELEAEVKTLKDENCKVSQLNEEMGVNINVITNQLLGMESRLKRIEEDNFQLQDNLNTCERMASKTMQDLRKELASTWKALTNYKNDCKLAVDQIQLKQSVINAVRKENVDLGHQVSKLKEQLMNMEQDEKSVLEMAEKERMRFAKSHVEREKEVWELRAKLNKQEKINRTFVASSREVIQLNRKLLMAAGETVQNDQEKPVTTGASHSKTCSMFSIVAAPPPTRRGRGRARKGNTRWTKDFHLD